MTQALDRVSELAGLGAQEVDVSAAKAQKLARREDQHQVATLVAVVRSLAITAVDEALDVFAALMADKLIKIAERTSRQAKLASLPRLRRASARLAAVARVLQQTRVDRAATDGNATEWDLEQVWAAIEQVVEPRQLDAAVEVVAELAPPQVDDNAAWRADLVDRWKTVRPFLPLLATAIPFGATTTGRPVLDAVWALPELIGRQKVRVSEICGELVTGSWRPLVYDGADLDIGCVDKHTYAMCVLEALYRALWHREVYAVGSKRWGDPRAQLLDGSSWEQLRPQVLTGLQLPEQAQQHLDEQAAALDTAWRELGARLAATKGQGPVRPRPAAMAELGCAWTPWTSSTSRTHW